MWTPAAVTTLVTSLTALVTGVTALVRVLRHERGGGGS